MKITVKTLKGEQFPLEVEPSDTILSVKEKLKELKNIEVEQQKLLHKGKMINNEQTLEGVGIKDNDFLVVTVVIKKPAPKPAQQQENKMEEEKPKEEPKQQEQQQQQPQQQQQQPQQQQSQSQQQQPQSDPEMVMGPEFEAAVNDIMAMGLGDGDKEKVKRALQAAYNNPERAIDYLLSGNIPEVRQQPPPQQQNQNQQQQEDGGEGAQGGNPLLAMLAQNPQFQQIRQLIQQNPQAAPQILGPLMQQIQQTNPEIFQLIQQNQQQFMEILMGGGAGGAGGQPQQPPPGTIQVTPEEKAAIDRIAGFGFDKMDALEAYMCCGKDENLALNYLLENQGSGGLMSEHIRKEEEDAVLQESLAQQQGSSQQPQQNQGDNNNNNNNDNNNNGGNNNDNNNDNNNNNNNNQGNNNNNNNGGDDGNIFD